MRRWAAGATEPADGVWVDLAALCRARAAALADLARRLTTAAAFLYSPDRGGEHPERHLARYAGLMQADAYAGVQPAL